MPGVPIPSQNNMQESDPDEPWHRALQELREELQAWRQVVDQRIEEALGLVRPLAAALNNLQEQNASLRAEQTRLNRRVAHLGFSMEKDPSTFLLESEDPCADFVGTEELGEPIAHPPTFSSTRRQSEVHLSRSGSRVSPQHLASDGHQ